MQKRASIAYFSLPTELFIIADWDGFSILGFPYFYPKPELF